LSIAELVAKNKLQKIGQRPRLSEYIRESWQRRTFAYTLARFNLQASTAKSSLGVAWLVLVPALQIMVYGLIFGLVL
jgi:teichoic acid transport system permease protein